MELIYFDDFLKKYSDKKIILTIGDFDGVHKAHRILIDKTIEEANLCNCSSAILSFEPHPHFVIGSASNGFLLNTLDEKQKILSNLNVDYLIIINFTKEFASLDKQTFISKYLNNLKIMKLIIGFDFKFGHFGEGSVKDLNNCKFETIVIDEQSTNNKKISSSLIRKLLLEGNVKSANELLNYNYSFTGIVKGGDKIGTKLGIPTCNLKIDIAKALIKNGVYAVNVICDDKKYYGLLNVGHNPTINFKEEVSYEVHILNFNNNIYKKELSIELIDFLRDEIIFNSTKELIGQIDLDMKKASSLFTK